MEFEINQIFVKEYPPEAAEWCNKSGKAYITELERDEEGNRVFQIVGIPEPTEEELAAQAVRQAKANRSDAVSKIIVEVDGMTFDGDETAQTRMARTIAALDEGETMPWVLADNTVTTVTRAQLKQALRLAGQAQAALWVKPYEEDK